VVVGHRFILRCNRISRVRRTRNGLKQAVHPETQVPCVFSNRWNLGKGVSASISETFDVLKKTTWEALPSPILRDSPEVNSFK
jgi:hypothetical protein